MTQSKSKLEILCSVFCFPPIITSITNKFAFTPPTPSTYSIKINSKETEPFEFTIGQSSPQNPLYGGKIYPYLIVSDEETTIACLHLIRFETPLYTILYSHGNACDLGTIYQLLMALGVQLNCNIVSYDYSGYGSSTGISSEKNIIKNIENVYNFMIKNLNIEENKIILYGQSLGSVPTINLAAKEKVCGVILQSPIASGLRIMFPSLIKTPFFDVFKNCEKIKEVYAPVLIMHGLNDETVHFQHSFILYDNAPNKVEPLWMSGIGHNGAEAYREFLPTLKRFINQDLKKHSQP